MITRTCTSHSVNEAIGAELVTDGGFAAVTEGAEIIASENDRTLAGASNWVNVDIGSYDATGDLSLVSSAAQQYCRLPVANAPQSPKKTYVIRFDLSGYTQGGWYIKDFLGNTISGDIVGDGAKVIYFTPTEGTGGLRIVAINTVSDGNFDNFSLKEVTFTSWTAGIGWAPQATAGSLTGKAQKVAGTASDLEQDVSAVAVDVYRVVHTATRTAGSETAEVGGTGGAARSTADTFTDNIRAATTGNLKIGADASFAGTVDTFSCKRIIRRAAPD